MAFSAILRRSASTVVPLAARLVAGQRFRHAAAVVSSFVRRGSLFHQRNSTPAPATGFSGHRYYSASSDKKLLEVIESEIQCAVESNEQDEGLDAPDGFPFKILDNPGQSVVTLEREYQGENITVEVSMPDLADAALDENGDDNDDDEEKSPETTIPLVVRIAKKNGTLIEFACTVHPDEISIDALSMKDPKVSEEDLAYEGPDFADLDENLQKAFLKYLDTRGIKPSTIGFMHDYMINKDDKEYLNWLNELKSFVQA